MPYSGVDPEPNSQPHQNGSQHSCDAARHLEEALLGSLTTRSQYVGEQRVHGDVQHWEGQTNANDVGTVVQPHIHLGQVSAPT